VLGEVIPHSKPWIQELDVEAVGKVLRSNIIAQGDTTRAFEKVISAQCGAIDGVSQSCGTAALFLALRTLGVGEGNEVVLPTYVCRSVMNAVTATGALPRLADVNDSGLLTSSTARLALSPRTKAIVGVHLFGNYCDIEGLKSLGQPVIEDACQAIGLESNGRKAGSSGDLAVFSFHATKVLTTGEGGMVVSNNYTLIKRARFFTSELQGSSSNVFAPISDLQSALGLSQFQRLGEMLDRRRAIATCYDEAINGVPGVTLATPRSNCVFRYVFQSKLSFKTLDKHFSSRGICIRHGVDTLLHRLRSEDDTLYPNATRLFETIVSIPCYPALTDSEVDRVCQALRALR
jgi:perosamine synthetase